MTLKTYIHLSLKQLLWTYVQVHMLFWVVASNKEDGQQHGLLFVHRNGTHPLEAYIWLAV